MPPLYLVGDAAGEHCIWLGMQLASTFTTADLGKMANLMAVVHVWVNAGHWLHPVGCDLAPHPGQVGCGLQNPPSCHLCRAATDSQGCVVKFPRCFLAASRA